MLSDLQSSGVNCIEIALHCDRGEDNWLHDEKRRGVIIKPCISSWAATVSLTHMGSQSTGSSSAKTAKEWDPPFRCTQPCQCVLWLELEAWPIFIQKHSAASPPSLVRGSPIVRGLLVVGTGVLRFCGVTIHTENAGVMFAFGACTEERNACGGC